MNITSILDFYYSNSILILVSVLGIVGIFLFVFFKSSKSKSIFTVHRILIGIVLILLFFLLIGNCGRYGYVKTIKKITQSDGVIAVLDEREVNEDNVFRIQAIDAKNGKRLSRYYLGEYCELYLQREYNVFIKKRNSFYLMDILNGKIVRSFEPKEIAKKYPLITYGVESVLYDANSEEKNRLLEIRAKDGKIYYIEPFSGTLYNIKHSFGNNKSIFVYYDYIKKKDKNKSYEDIIFSLENKPETHKVKIFRPYDKKINIGFPEFIEPIFLQVYPQEERIVILSYETTDKKDFIVSGYDFNCDFVWNIKQKDEILKDKRLKNTSFNTSAIQDQNLIFNSSGILYSVNVITGVVNWNVKL